MMRFISPQLVLLLLSAAISSLSAQNIVSNGSFEDFAACPGGQGDIQNATPWNGFPETSDFFHSCSGGEVGVPDNGPGSQTAYVGKGYAGIIVNWNDRPYDYIYAPLNTSLRSGESYCISMWISCADEPRLATDDLCIFFTEEEPNTEILDRTRYSIRNPEGNILDNTDDWRQISEDYVARGGEQFIVIGSCRTEPRNYKTINTAPYFEPDTYYYIDEVSVTSQDFELEIAVNSNIERTYCAGDTIELITNAGNAGKSVWNDGTEGPTLAIASSGVYSVTTQIGCDVYEATYEITFDDCSCDLITSNVFSPNSDGINDTFLFIPKIEVARYELEIYNRWGKQVFKTSDINDAWDGLVNGQQASTGVYVWTAKIMCIKDNQIIDNQLKGYVTLLR